MGGKKRKVLPSSKPALSRKKKFLYAIVVNLGLLVIIELLLTLIGIQPLSITEDPYVGFQKDLPLFIKTVDKTGKPIYQTSPNKTRFFNLQNFPGQKGKNDYRIFVMGGSTTHGRPYGDDRVSFSEFLRQFLNCAQPTGNFQVINCGGISYASYRLAALMDELIKYKPDLFIVYSGHNEFLEYRTYEDIIEKIEKHPAIVRIQIFLYRSRLYSIIGRGLSRLKNRRSESVKKSYQLTGEVDAILDTSAGLDLYRRDDRLRRQILAHFRYNLERMARIARFARARIIFVQPASNIKDFSPFKSQHIEKLQLNAWQDYVRKGEEAMKTGDYQEAIVSYRGALDIDNRYGDTYYHLGKVLFALGRMEEAKDAFEKAVVEDVCPLRILPSMNEIIRSVADENRVMMVDFKHLLEERCRKENGHTILGKEYFIDHCHPTIQTSSYLGKVLLNLLIKEDIVKPKQGLSDAEIDEVAIEVAERVTERDQAIAMNNLAKVLHWAGKMEEADRLATMAVKVLPTDAQTLFQMGITMEGKGKFEEAIRYYKKAIKFAPRDAIFYNNLGVVYAKSGRSQEAIKAWMKAIELKLARAEAVYYNIGITYAESGRLKEAIQYLRKSVEFKPEFLLGYNKMGEVFQSLGQSDEAIRCYQKAIELKPDSPLAYYNLGNIYCELGKEEEAIASYKKVIDIKPDYGEAHNNLAVAYYYEKQYGSAIKHCDWAVRLGYRVHPEFLELLEPYRE